VPHRIAITIDLRRERARVSCVPTASYEYRHLRGLSTPCWPHLQQCVRADIGGQSSDRGANGLPLRQLWRPSQSRGGGGSHPGAGRVSCRDTDGTRPGRRSPHVAPRALAAPDELGHQITASRPSVADIGGVAWWPRRVHTGLATLVGVRQLRRRTELGTIREAAYRKELPMSKKGGNKTSKAGPKPPMANKGPKKK
jgi:hypothetical protein